MVAQGSGADVPGRTGKWQKVTKWAEIGEKRVSLNIFVEQEIQVLAVRKMEIKGVKK